jgi:DNA polymerase-1
MAVQFREETALLEERIYEQAGERFNLASPKQLGPILFDKLKLVDKPKKTKTGQYSTAEDVLSYAWQKIMRLLLMFWSGGRSKS